MKLSLLSFFVFITSFTLAQSGDQPIPGTKLSLSPPEGFVVATNFSGFQHEELGASILVVEIPGPFSEVKSGFTAVGLAEKGMKELSRETPDFNGSTALYLKASQEAHDILYHKQILVFGDEEKTVLVTANYPDFNSKIEAEVKKALFSTKYNEGQETDPLAAVDFTIDVSSTGFTFAKFMAGTLLYTSDGKIPSQGPGFMAGASVAPITSDHKEYSLKRLKELPDGKTNVVQEITPVTIDNLEGYEIVAHGKTEDGKAQLMYQVMLFKEKGYYYMMVGTATDDFETNLANFKTAARTFKRK